jgi:hypothetical protein
MKTPVLTRSAWLLAIGATATLLIGAFARFDPTAAEKRDVTIAPPATALAEGQDALESAGGPTFPADLSPGLAEIIRLAQAHVDEGVILSYIQNSGQVYAPSADEILYLSDLGVSQTVLAALFKGNLPTPTPGTPAIAVTTPTGPKLEATPSVPTNSDSSYFYNSLSPYGAWTQVPDYGLAWQPTVETINPDWRPYLDQGQWLDTDSGWYWQSDYTWGWAVFHYGRWANTPRLGWVWVPDKVWAPSWVAWRSTGNYFGWAPLPPGVSLNVLGQLTSFGHAPGTGYGIPASCFAFVSADNFLTRNLFGVVVPALQVGSLFASSTVVENYSIENDKVINGGISRAVVAAAARKSVQTVALHPVATPPAVSGVVNRTALAVYRPDVSAAASAGASEFLINKPRAAVTAALPATEPNPEMVADILPAESPVFPGPQPSEPTVQLPPLRYPAPPPRLGMDMASTAGIETVSPPRHIHHNRNGQAPVQRPASEPPQIEEGPGGSRPAPLALESHRMAEEPRPPAPAPEPSRAAAPQAGGNSKSAK